MRSNHYYIIAALLASLGLIIPMLMIFAVIIAFIPLLFPSPNNEIEKRNNDNKSITWTSVLSNNDIKKNNNDDNKNKNDDDEINNYKYYNKNETINSSFSDDIENEDIWKRNPSKDDQAIVDDSNHKLLVVPMPWEQSNSNLLDPGFGIVSSDLGFSFRSDKSYHSNFQIRKVGRIFHSFDSSEFESKIADNPIDEYESITSGNIDITVNLSRFSKTNSSFLTKMSKIVNDNEIIRSGDIVCLKYDLIQDSYLTVKNEWSLGFTDSNEKIDERSLFTIVIEDETGDISYGLPLVAGTLFKLRSAKWPRYEIGYHQIEENSENDLNPLILYEWSSRLVSRRGPLRWKHGGNVTPLLSTFVRSELTYITCRRKNSNGAGFSGWFKKRSKVRALQVRVMASTDFYHRTTLQSQQSVVVVSNLIISDDYSKKWTCIRSLDHLSSLLDTLEATLEHDMNLLKNKKIKNDEINNYVELHYETQLDRNIRALNQRIERLFRLSLEYNILGTSSLSDVIGSSPIMLQLQDYLQCPQIYDSWYLSGNVEQFSLSNTDKPIYSSVLARAVWETNWVEEVAHIYPTHISFISPLTRKATWNLLTKELNGVSKLSDEENPFPGYSILRITTLDQLFYLAFSTRERREKFASKLIATMAEVEMLLISDNADGFIFYTGQWLPPTRKILNGRKFSFDQSKSFTESPLNFSIRLLKDVFFLDPHFNEDINVVNRDYELDLERLTSFFDELAMLKTIDIKSFDLKSPEVICFFANIYHTLYMHARLVVGTPSKNEWSSFYSLSCYEIGCNVFSLLELYNCVLRGVLSQSTMQSKFEPPALSPNDDHYYYAIQKVDYRINFLLNTGTKSYLNTIHLVTPANLENQLNIATRSTLEKYLKVDSYRNSVTLPKFCETYRDDFGTDAYDLLQKCLTHLLGAAVELDLRKVISNEKKQPRLLYHTYLYESHAKMKLIT